VNFAKIRIILPDGLQSPSQFYNTLSQLDHVASIAVIMDVSAGYCSYKDGHLLLYTLSHIEPSGNAPVRPGYNELTLQRATAACHVQCPNSNSLMKVCIKSLQRSAAHNVRSLLTLLMQRIIHDSSLDFDPKPTKPSGM
jgi:hypothetical protein